MNGEDSNWFGPFITGNGATAQTLTVNNADTTGQARLNVKLQGLTELEHQVNVRFNNIDLGVVSLSNKDNETFEFNVPTNAVLEGANTVSLQSVGTGNDISLVDTVSLTYPRRYLAANDTLRFSVPASESARFGGFSANADVRLFEVNANTVSRQVIAQQESGEDGVAYSLAASNADREFLAVADSAIAQPARVQRNIPSRWHASTNKADFVIITPEQFGKPAFELANRRIAQGLQTNVVYVEDLYDEFSFGEHSPTAIREFLNERQPLHGRSNRVMHCCSEIRARMRETISDRLIWT